jgi:predicted nucleic acid-binding protein
VALILDTGPLYAAIDRRDTDHARCRALIEQSSERLVVPSPVLPELDYLVNERVGVGPMLAFLQDIEDGAFDVENLVSSDYPRVRELMDTYADADLGFVDSAVIAVAERFEEPKIATLDHRHFAVVRPRHVDALQLLP